jgi:hypothetical protein
MFLALRFVPHFSVVVCGSTGLRYNRGMVRKTLAAARQDRSP